MLVIVIVMVALLAAYFMLVGSRRTGPVVFAFIDKSGRVKFRLGKSQLAGSFSEGLAAVSVNGKWGYVDTEGHFVIHPQFGSAGDFSEGLAVVTSSPTDQYWRKDTLFGTSASQVSMSFGRLLTGQRHSRKVSLLSV